MKLSLLLTFFLALTSPLLAEPEPESEAPATEEASAPVQESAAPPAAPAPVAAPEPVVAGTSSGLLAVGFQVGQTVTEISESGDQSRTSFTGGALVELQLMNTFSIQAELNYIEKGYFRPSLLPVRDGASLKYLEVPLFLKARAHWNNLAPSLFAGPSIAYLHSATQVDSGVSFDKTSTTNRFEYGLYVGAGLDFILSQNLELGASVRYGWGLSSIEEAPQIAGVYNRVFHWVGNVKFRF
ncbi:PorT family protein [bacterium]|nr:PorT family protein [bacterium]